GATDRRTRCAWVPSDGWPTSHRDRTVGGGQLPIVVVEARDAASSDRCRPTPRAGRTATATGCVAAAQVGPGGRCTRAGWTTGRHRCRGPTGRAGGRWPPPDRPADRTGV